jgi:hypothetical protein
MISNTPKRPWPFLVSQMSRPKPSDANVDAIQGAMRSASIVRDAKEPYPHRDSAGKTEGETARRPS